jgi:hypothetical protein
MTTSPALEKAMVTKPITLHLMPREDGGLRIKADELPGLILSNMDHAALFRDLPEVIRDLIAHGGYTPSLPSGGEVVMWLSNIAGNARHMADERQAAGEPFNSTAFTAHGLRSIADACEQAATALTASETERERLAAELKRLTT